MAGQIGQLGDRAEGALDSVTGAAKNAVGSILGADGAGGGAAAPNPAELAEQVYQLLERRLIVERERGGFRR